ncbi:MAG TPA: type IV secretion system protein [Steroidobacteraceae bacterium]|jgi:type IV secretion system protein VirB8
MTSDRALGEYFREAASWDHDKAAATGRSARIAWRVAAAGWLCAIGSSLALAFAMPLKRVEAFVIRVDNSTGVVDVVPEYDGTARPAEVVTRYFLTHYVTVCERFDFPTAESDYAECGAFNTSQRNQLWYALWNPANPASPLNVHKDGSTVRVEVASVSFFKRSNSVADLAQVRYLKAERAGAGGEERFSHWTATIQYTYAAPAKDPRTRRWNPLGFRVLDFTAEPEVVADVDAGRKKEQGR